MSKTRLATLFVLVHASVPAAWAQQKPKIQVSFEIAPGHPYGSQTYPPAELSFIESATTGVLVDALRQRIGFLEFVRTAEPYRLRVTLENEDPGALTSATHSVGFRPRLEKAGTLHGDTTFWLFRDAQRYSLVTGDKETFGAELTIKLQALVQTNYQELVSRLLCRVPVAVRAFRVPASDMFVFPFSGRELDIGGDSRFQIEAEITDPVGLLSSRYTARVRGHTLHGDHQYPSEYRNKLIAKALEPLADIPLLQGSAPVSAKAIYVIKYEQGDGVRPTTPENFQPGGGAHP
jgi:hypothetical protein